MSEMYLCIHIASAVTFAPRPCQGDFVLSLQTLSAPTPLVPSWRSSLFSHVPLTKAVSISYTFSLITKRT